MSTIKLKGSSSGEAEVTVAAAAGTPTFTLPTTVGSANQLLKNSGTAGTLEYSNNLTFDGSKLLLNTTTEGSGSADDLTITSPDGTANAGITIRCGVNNAGNIYFSDATSGTGEYAGWVTYAHGSSGEALTFGTNSTEKLRVESGGNVKIVDGDLVIGTTGHGIDFSATSDASGTGVVAGSELLDDYEEGTWTPSNPNVAFYQDTSLDGTYTKIGNRVFFDCILRFSSTSDATGAYIDGFPFTSAGSGGDYDHGASVTYSNNYPAVASALFQNGTSRIWLYGHTGSTPTLAAMSNDYVRLQGQVVVS